VLDIAREHSLMTQSWVGASARPARPVCRNPEIGPVALPVIETNRLDRGKVHPESWPPENKTSPFSRIPLVIS